MENRVVPVILAGGQGTRLWPMSRAARPKQFLALTGPQSLYQETLKRVCDRSIYAAPVVITNEDYRFVVAEQALEIGIEDASFLLEPMARGTAAAIAAAAVFVQLRSGSASVLHVLPSDHAIIPDECYWTSVQTAAAAARAGQLVTFGITPTGPQTGYGYIEAGEPNANGIRRVKRFVEKPDLARATEMVMRGGFTWNSGMFMMVAQDYLDECRRLSPETLAAANYAVCHSTHDLDFVRLDKPSFATAPEISVDYAIFEKTDRATVLAVDFIWSDLGSWDAVWEVSEKDDSDNASIGKVTFSSTDHSLVVTERAHVAIAGLSDIVVIASEDAIYVGRLSTAQTVGALVKALKLRHDTRHLTEIHRTAHRPWGGYSQVLDGERFQVKRLFVKPGKKLSLQRHHHRSEHWIVVRGTAEVTIDGTVSMLSENQSIYLPLGCTHRLANPGKIQLELIEVQTGSYLGEDDIIRIEDEFGRA